MSTLSDLVTAVFKPQRQFGPFSAQITIEELHTDELAITEHPVEQGAAITDHAYKRPAELLVRMAWSNSGLQGLVSTLEGIASLITGDNSGDFNYMQTVYNQLLLLQESRIPLDITTGKRKYSNMLIKSLSAPTNDRTEHSLFITAICKQIIIVQTVATTLPDPSVMANPDQNAPVIPTGTLQPQVTAFQLRSDGSIGPQVGIHQ